MLNFSHYRGNESLNISKLTIQTDTVVKMIKNEDIKWDVEQAEPYCLANGRVN